MEKAGLPFALLRGASSEKRPLRAVAVLAAVLAACSPLGNESLDQAGGAPGEGTGGTGGGTGGTPGITGGAAAGGSANSTGGASGGTITGPVPGWPDATTNPGVLVRVRNLCAFPIWIHAAGSSGTLAPDDAKLESGDIIDYPTPSEWSAARVTAYGDGPRSGELEKAEMTIGAGILNYNVTYVDWVGLPLEVVGHGGSCDENKDFTGCYATASTINDGCPETFLKENGRCLSPRSYCLNPAHQGEAFCKKLDSAIASCSECPKGSTPEVYACSGVYAEEPRLCAALNRGISQTPDATDPSLFYQAEPYNNYSKWVHNVCPDIYAFSYDDWQSHGGFRSCAGNELRVTFCPAG